MRNFLLYLLVLLTGLAGADIILSGRQLRGHLTAGKLSCSGVRLPYGGQIVQATDSGAGFWMSTSGGTILRFPTGQKAVGTKLRAGTWYAYPNLLTTQESADVTVVIRTGQAGLTNSKLAGTSWIVNNHAVPWVFHSDGTVDAKGYWSGRWTPTPEGCDVVITAQGQVERLEIRLSDDGRTFKGFKNGELYRDGVLQSGGAAVQAGFDGLWPGVQRQHTDCGFAGQSDITIRTDADGVTWATSADNGFPDQARGRIVGNTYSFEYGHPGQAAAGTGTFTLSEDGRSFSGTFASKDGHAGRVTARR